MSVSTCRILLADDHAAMRRGVRSLLEPQTNWEIVGEAADGREALSLARETRPDVAILDYSLPGLNGVDLARQFKQEKLKTEVLIYTIHEKESIVISALEAGVRGYVLKTDRGDHLVAAIEALSRRKPYFSGDISQTLLEFYLQDNHPAGRKVELTLREREVVQLTAEGKTNKQIAYILGLALKTVEAHRSNAMHKLNLRTTADLARFAIRNDIVQP